MGLLRSVGRAALRGTGHVLAVHVVPDTLIPSWKTQRAIGRAASSVGRSVGKLGKKKKGKKGKATPGGGRATTGPRTSARASSPQRAKMPKIPKRPRPNLNDWSRGRALSVPESFSVLRPSSPPPSRVPASSLAGRIGRRLGYEFNPLTRRRRRQQLHDVRHHPRLVAQMHFDELFHDVRQIKMPWQSKRPY